MRAQVKRRKTKEREKEKETGREMVATVNCLF